MDRIADCLSLAVGKTYQQVQQEAKRRLAPSGVTPAQFAVQLPNELALHP